MTCLDCRSLWSRLTVVSALLASACSDEGGQNRSTPNVRNAQENENADASATWTRAPDEICDAREEENQEWVKGYLTCEHDADCETTEIGAECLSPFLCSTVLSTKIDRAAFEREARKRQAAYEAECGCAIARCVPSSDLEAYCDSSTKLCAHRSRRVAECAAISASQLLRDATQVDYDYKPLSAAALIEKSTLIVRGRLESMSTSDSGNLPRAVFAVNVADAYKGDAKPGDTVKVVQARSSIVTAEDLAKISRDFPDVSITLFVFPSESDGGYLLASMQGLVTASDCGVEQPFGDTPIFESASSAAEFDAALRAAITAAGD